MTERRFKSTDELSAVEHLLALRAKRRGEPPPRFERGAYSAAKIEALRDAGLEDEAAEHEEAAAAPQSVAGHLRHIRREHVAAARSPRQN